MSETNIDKCLEFIAGLKKRRYVNVNADILGMTILCLDVALKEIKTLREEIEKHRSK